MTEKSVPGISKRWFLRHPVIALVAVNVFAMLGAALVFELAFRCQVVDFYATELRSFNAADLMADDSRPTVLVLGDSFSAGLDRYPFWLQDRLGPSWRVVNGGIPGITAGQASFVLENRLVRFSPRLVVYQTYVGNDLLDIRHPISWRKNNPLRNGYWVLTDGGWTSLAFLNYRLGQIKNRFLGSVIRPASSAAPEAVAELDRQPFSVTRYRAWERILLAADPWIIERQIAVTGSIEPAWRAYSEHVQSMVRRCRREGIRLIVVVIPHCTQIHQRYRERFAALGARFDRPEALAADEYPFVTRLRADVENTPHVVVLDSLEALRRAEAMGRATYRNNDDHLNDDGQQILGHFLFEQGIMPSVGEPAAQPIR